MEQQEAQQQNMQQNEQQKSVLKEAAHFEHDAMREMQMPGMADFLAMFNDSPDTLRSMPHEVIRAAAMHLGNKSLMDLMGGGSGVNLVSGNLDISFQSPDLEDKVNYIHTSVPKLMDIQEK